MAYDQGTKMNCRVLLGLVVLALTGLPKPIAQATEDGSLGPDSWTTWSARKALAPAVRFSKQPDTWTVQGNGKPMRHGGWDLNWTKLPEGEWHELSIDCRHSGIASIQDNAHVELIYWRADGKRADWRHVGFAQSTEGRLRYSAKMPVPANAVRATARLMLRWTGKGKLAFSGVNLRTIERPERHRIKTAIITGKPPGNSLEANVAFAEKLVREAARRGAQVICLPEVVTTWRIKAGAEEIAETIPGPQTRRFARLARDLNVDINFSMHEIDAEGLIYNTAVYFDARRGLIGKYRKVHLAVGERWKGITPGDSFPVWETRFGKAGMLVCYDNVHPEGHRILSQKGAKVIFLPIMGDPRAVGSRAYEKWLQIMCVRAMDNHVWMVVCQNNGDRGVIIRPDGEVITEVDPGDGFAMAEIDMNFRHASWIGSDFLNRNWGERRPMVYRDLIEDR